MNKEITPIEKYVAILFGLLVIAFTAYSQFMISGFVELFSEIEVEIPKSTQLIFATYRWWVLLAVVAIIGVFQAIYLKARNGLWLVSGAMLIAFILLPITVWSMYAPVMQ